jgi:hypothetical protein
MGAEMITAMQSQPNDEAASSTTVSRRFIGFPNFQRNYDDPERKWESEVLRRLIRYTKLEPGWDSYGSPPVGMDTAFFAMLILEAAMTPRTPLPQVVPTAKGGVQIEWHQKGIDLEIHVESPNRCEMWFDDHRSDEEPISQEFSTNFSSLITPIQRLTSR